MASELTLEHTNWTVQMQTCNMTFQCSQIGRSRYQFDFKIFKVTVLQPSNLLITIASYISYIRLHIVIKLGFSYASLTIICSTML